MVTLINGLVGIVAGLLVIITTYYLFLKYLYAPKFIIGILPENIDIDDMGTESKIDEFYFNEKYLAKRIHTDKDLKKLKEDIDRIRVYGKK